MLDRVHEARVQADADFAALRGDLDSVERLRAQKKISLNLDQRRAEREATERERLARENARRKARGLEPLATTEDLDAADQPDAVLAEAAEIAADLYIGSTPAGGALLTQADPGAGAP